MIVGIGVDVEAVARIARELARDAESLRERVFTPGEVAYCEGKRYPAPHYAARFAAKEALFKALGAPELDAGSWREVEVASEPTGRPNLILHGRLRAAAARARADRILVSLSHTRTWAVANVVLESNGDRAEKPCD